MPVPHRASSLCGGSSDRAHGRARSGRRPLQQPGAVRDSSAHGHD
ncbi:hypothetical protein SNL152K_9099 [Streptomyces sp. NL15-2K]|nr:hypothetical protein SNL152K_9099 [Streptomyces sp. NL15-2K]